MVSERFIKTMRGVVTVNYNDDRSAQPVNKSGKIEKVENGILYLSDKEFKITRIKIENINKVKVIGRIQ